jgi:GNAT superfamily N-acetyltransferase
VAWIAVSKNQAEQTGLGIARFIRSMQQPGVAEFAMVVLDSYQNRGLGSIFMSLLYKLAHSKNIEILQAAVLSENTVMSTWLSRLGAVGTFDNGSYRMDLKISTELSTLASTSLQRVHFYVNHLDEAFQPRPEGV